MKMLTVAFLILCASHAWAQTEDDYKKFCAKAQKAYKITEEEAKKFTDIIKDVRTSYSEIIKKLSEHVDEKNLNTLRLMLPNITEKTLKSHFRMDDDEKVEKVVEIAKEAKEKIDKSIDKIREAISEKVAKMYDHPIRGFIMAKELRMPVRWGPKTDEEILEEILDEMNIDDKETKAKVSKTLKDLLESKSQQKKISRELTKLLYKKELTDEESQKAQDLVKDSRAKSKEIDKLEDELFGLVTAKQFIAYMKVGNYPKYPPPQHDPRPMPMPKPMPIPEDMPIPKFVPEHN